MTDVAARLAEGTEALTDTATYVAACAAVGRHYPGLTPQLIGQAYFAEAGLQLTALDADIRALVSAAAAADDALSVERRALDVLGQGWSGESGSAAAEFVARHCAAAATVITALHEAVEVLVRLRRSLALRVDEKVDTTVRVGDRADRAVWLSAAEGVLRGGVGDPAAAVVTDRVAPYVSADVAAEWLPAMRSGSAGVSAAYRQAAAELAELPAPTFEIATAPALAAPGTGRGRIPPVGGPGPGPVTAPAPAPVTAPAPAPLPPSPTAPGPYAAAAPASPVGFAAPSVGADPPVETALGPAPRRVRRREPVTESDEPPAEDAAEETPDEPAAELEDSPEIGGEPTAPPAAVLPAAPPEPAPEPAPEPVPEPLPPSTPPLAPLLAAEAPAPERTPCEIAADELPQVGQ